MWSVTECRLTSPRMCAGGPRTGCGVETRLQLIEEVVCGPQDTGTVMEEAMEHNQRVLERRDREAEDEAVVDRMRAELRELAAGLQ